MIKASSRAGVKHAQERSKRTPPKTTSAPQGLGYREALSKKGSRSFTGRFGPAFKRAAVNVMRRSSTIVLPLTAYGLVTETYQGNRPRLVKLRLYGQYGPSWCGLRRFPTQLHWRVIWVPIRAAMGAYRCCARLASARAYTSRRTVRRGRRTSTGGFDRLRTASTSPWDLAMRSSSIAISCTAQTSIIRTGGAGTSSARTTRITTGPTSPCAITVTMAL